MSETFPHRDEAPDLPLLEPSSDTLATALGVSPHAALLVQLIGPRALAVWGNPACRRLLAGSPRDPLVLRGVTWTRIGKPLDPHEDPLGDLLARGGGREDLALRRVDGSAVHVRVHAYPLEEVLPLWVVHLEELTEVRRATEQLHASEARMHALAAHAPIGIFASEAGLRLAFANPRAAELLGRDPQALLSTGWMGAVDERDLPAVVEGLAATLAGGEVDLTLRVADVSDRWLRLRAGPVDLPGQGIGFIGSLEDVTRERAHQEALSHQALHDPLTGLPNRTALRTEIDAILHGRRGGDGSLALLFFDLDHFKIVNDSLGHAVGDALLVEVAQRLDQRVRIGDTLARFGGDEFVLLCPGVVGTDLAVSIAERMIAGLDEPIELEGRSFRAAASVGVVVTTGSATAETLLRDADVAMYQAKNSGRGRLAVFDEEARRRADRRLRVVTDLRRALGAAELTLAYQPIVDLRSGDLLGAEALLRWRHHEHGTIPIPELIDLAEETGLIVDVGTFVLGAACADLARWRAEEDDGGPGWVSINVSATQLADVGFPAQVSAVVAAHALAPGDICIELTESALLDGAEGGSRALEELRLRGFRVAIDDFGTGYSSLAYLKDMPIDVVKIARPFVAGLTDDPRDAAIIEAIIGLAEAIGVEVIAEGIETDGQRSALDELRCRAGQGYLLGRPDQPDALTRYVPHPATVRAAADPSPTSRSV